MEGLAFGGRRCVSGGSHDVPLMSFGGSTMPSGGLLTSSSRVDELAPFSTPVGAIIQTVFDMCCADVEAVNKFVNGAGK